MPESKSGALPLGDAPLGRVFPGRGIRIKGAEPVRKPAKMAAPPGACSAVAGAGGHRYKGASRGEGRAPLHWFGE